MGFFSRARVITFVNAQVLGPDAAVASSLRIERGRVADLDVGPGSKDLVVDLDGAVVLPGLINAHDHLELNSFPRLKWRERYGSARDWIADFQPWFATEPALRAARPETLADRLLIGGIKNLLSGTTTVCHHNPLYPPLRRNFPVRVVTHYGFSHSLLIDGDSVGEAYRRTPRDWPWIIHAAEGTDAEAAAEAEKLERLGCLRSNTVLVHGLGLGARDRRTVIDSGGALVWCPTSNAFLFGATADVRDFIDARRLALGTDSRLSGEGDLLVELKSASRTGQASACELVRAVTSDAASILRLAAAGRLARGVPADLVVVPPLRRHPFESLLAADRSDLRLTMIGGRPVVGDRMLAPVFAAAGVPAAPIRVDGAPKLLARALAERLARSTFGEPGLEVEP